TYTEFGPGGYGLGVAVRSYRGHKHVSHTGGIDGFISSMSWLPHDRLGIVVLTNFSGVNPVAGMLAQNLTDRLLGVEPVDVVARAREAQARSERLGTERERKKEAERIHGTSPSHPLADYAGSYEHPGYGLITIAHDSGRLTLTLGSAVTTFEHFHYDVFRAVKTPDTNDWDTRMRMVFSSGASGRIDTVGVPLEASGPDLLFKRKPAVAGTSSAAMR
ncbi:MAG: DUF3471 domain-containing protein, partial [Acidobacteria bacterium]|nr:DUF3471 domain-containing protein [Acidobacteriota bacterium]